ncbi:Cytochrome c-type biogenesis protein DsbD,protein-disulfide reductase [Acinetobacter bereziniae]|uniref:protein-disulfide reductase DsbD n=1 Tax=Acinetobacter bereziniae TaxID=106648 RepID=UPI000573292E|nr:protein-disulfide reductase DsbD [Acinetobacter bereziniae]CEI53171.1 Cytochrome c-type biogenesis protein DsbD,protein-disulfide reductase [Acinetobacter bereziniae]
MKLRTLFSVCCFTWLGLSTFTHANPEFLAPDQAFQFSAESLSENKAQLNWTIAPHYYLYHDQFKVTVNNKAVPFSLQKGHIKDDPTFGKTEVHYESVSTTIQVKPNTQYVVMYQGCSADGLCYPLQRKNIATDADGLLPQNNTASKNMLSSRTNNSLLSQSETAPSLDKNIKNDSYPAKIPTSNADNAEKNSNIATTTNVQKNINQDQSTEARVDPNQVLSSSAVITNKSNSSPLNTNSSTNDHTTSLQWNDDQSFFKLLSKDSLFLNLLVFFGLGILLAFLPCSLPLIPILSGIIIQRAKGYKAVVIALSFVVSMAVIYAIMGIVVAEIGYSFQRWFQSPWIVSLFAVLFVILALNLFGLYQLNLPQFITNKLSNLQNNQKAGTILGAVVMGALSALIVGPCMSAPLAGALLFVSQTQNAALGGLYLFILGLGIGVPLFIASVFGSKLLPKPGKWMDRIKVSFGFVMLMVALYFIRPMLPSTVYAAIFALLCIALAIYLFIALRDSEKVVNKAILAVIAVLSLFAGLWNIQQGYTAYQIQHSQSEHLVWKKVTTAEQLESALVQAKQQNKPIIIDVYADWCVACQPIEKEVFPRVDVQDALKNFTLIQLDLTEYNASQDIILKQREILGPPTMLFLNHHAEEIRELRFTGTFSAQQLLKQTAQVQEILKAQ